MTERNLISTWGLVQVFHFDERKLNKLPKLEQSSEFMKKYIDRHTVLLDNRITDSPIELIGYNGTESLLLCNQM